MPITGREMKRPQEIHFLSDETVQAGELLDSLAPSFVIEETERLTGKKQYYDTFDWRLFRAGCLFTFEGQGVELSRFNGVPVAAIPAGRREQYFWWDIRESELREKIRSIIEMRAMLPLLSLDYDRKTFRVLNKDRKTVARIVLRNEQASAGGAHLALPERLSLHEIRGYGNVFDKICKSCSTAGLRPVDTMQELLTLAFSVSNRKPLDYGAKFRVELPDSGTVGEAVAKICLALAEAMATNHAGVCKDIDSEFLHDFRIAVRRTRSLLSLLKKELPPEQTTFFQAEFKWLGDVTGPVRDIDVYLLKREEYLAMLPATLHAGLNLFFDELDRRRKSEVKRLRRCLLSQRYQKLIDEWYHYLSTPDSALFAARRNRRCRVVADKQIKKRFASFLRDGDAITVKSPDREMHRLRIKGKKLRYLLEFFRAFYDDAEVERFLKHMKKLQDNLGALNDLSVQQQMLAARLAQLDPRTERSMQIGASLGGLISVLAGKKKRVRSAFRRSYADFSKASNRDLLNSLIADSRRGMS